MAGQEELCPCVLHPHQKGKLSEVHQVTNMCPLMKEAIKKMLVNRLPFLQQTNFTTIWVTHLCVVWA